MKLEKTIATFDNTYRYVKVGQYSDKEGQGDLYYDTLKNDFYKEKDYEYLVEFDSPVKVLLYNLLKVRK